ncbi:hypothetical protein AEM51_00590 [Bacteroidetes bacterium UKL13-3]|jgi:hypothetical protein|nr:hypothetical protein AEM51_00590 [Bacteroidetes bacterium UKL13-3]
MSKIREVSLIRQVKSEKKLLTELEIGSFAKLGSCVGLCGFANVPMNGWLKLFFKMCLGKFF